MSDSRQKDDGRDELAGRLRDVARKAADGTQKGFSVDAYSLASQRRAIAYGRARGRS